MYRNKRGKLAIEEESGRSYPWDNVPRAIQERITEGTSLIGFKGAWGGWEEGTNLGKLGGG